jgi:hypothetical protein
MNGHIMSGITIRRRNPSRTTRRHRALHRTLSSCTPGVREEVLDMLDQGTLSI